MKKLWIVEVDQGGINWTPIACCLSQVQAERLALRLVEHKARIREYGQPVF